MDILAILNTIQANASQTYQDRIPVATRTNLEQIRYAMIDDDNLMVANEFMSTLLNKIVKSVVHTKRFANPLKSLKKGKKPIGDSIEEIYTNFLKGQEHKTDGGATALMQRHLPDVKTVYHRMNYKMQYPVTVDRDRLSKAFASFDALENFINDLIAALYNSAELDEFDNFKQLIASALEKKAVKVVEIADPLTSEQNARDFIKAVKTTSRMMTFPSDQWNGYLTAQATDKKPIVTFSRKEEQVLILDAATDIGVSVDVLAATFNMSVADFNDTRKIVIDAFPVAGVRAALLDEAFFQVLDDLYNITSWNNPQALYTNYYLNVWQTLAYSILVNAVVFKVKDAA